jgi:elongator complex protein 3
MLKLVPNYCRVMRIMREIPTEYLVAGTTNIGLRKDLEDELRKQKIKLKEIRYREIGFANKENLNKELRLKITRYKASQGTEYFLEIINKDNILFGLLRLRISKLGAIIREVHVYGQSLNIGQKGENSQHTGLGKQLIAKAEEITKKSKHNKLKIISGIGVREYYKKLGYKLEDTYMTKKLN